MTLSLRIAAIIVAVCFHQLLAAQEYPVKPIRLVIPNTPGGALDIAARLTQPRMTEILGQPFIMDYRVAAGGVVGANLVAKSQPDGYTLIMVFDSFAINPYLFKDVQYDPVKDFQAISMLVQGVQVLVANPSLGARTFNEFMQLAKARGAALDFATAGPGSSSRFSMELFKQATGIGATPIHYKGGGALVPALLSGEVPVTIMTYGTVASLIKSGKLIALAITSAQRSPVIPHVPTIAEAYPGFEARSWMGLLAPARTPSPIVNRVYGAMLQALAIPAVKANFEDQGYEVIGTSPETFAAWIRNESAKWSRLISERNIKVD